MKVYFDNAATTKLHPKVLEKMLPFYKDNFGNPSSFHSVGKKARVAIEAAREIAADFIGANPGEIYFTSGGTESINFALNGIAKTNLNETGKNYLITTAVEHKAVLEKHHDLQQNGFDVEILPVKSDSSIDENLIESKLTEKTSLVSVMFTNNETGTINDIKTISQKLSPEDIYFFTDAVQAFGKVKIDVNDLGIHSLSASAHKITERNWIAVCKKRDSPFSASVWRKSRTKPQSRD
ncbi:MAG: aminotransferase class V-fold PLP-dependent enzyme [Chlorobi bacterium]|nr:aminotransferase class V-fold PLP-dependent enzyme [Chlorobiota bacterium]